MRGAGRIEVEGLATTLLPPPGLGSRVAGPFRMEGVAFSAGAGERIAVLGRNGAGKTTLLRLLGGIFRPRGGRVTVRGTTTPVVGLSSLFEPRLTVREQVESFAALAPLDVDEALAFAGLETVARRPVRWLSSGERVRLALGPALLVDADVYLVDEGLGLCDPGFRERALGRLRARADDGATVLLAGQHLLTARALCHRGLVLEDGRLVFDGPMREAVARFLETRPPGEPVVFEEVTLREGGGAGAPPRLACRIRGARPGHVLMTALRDDDGRIVTMKRTPIREAPGADAPDPGTAVEVALEADGGVTPGRYAVSVSVVDADGNPLATRNDAVVVQIGG